MNSKILIPILASLVFGFYPAFAQLVFHDGANATFLVIGTSMARALVLLFFCLATRKPFIPHGKDWYVALSGGFFQAVSIFGIITSLQYLPGPVTIVIVFTSTLMLLFWLVFKKEVAFDFVTVLCTVGALTGISLVVDVWHVRLTTVPWLGLVLAFVAAIATASRIYVFGKQLQSGDPAVVGAQIFSFSTFFLCLPGIFSPPTAPLSSIGYLALSACCISLVLGTFAMFYGIAALGSFQYSLMAKLEPVFTAIVSFLVLKEVLNGYQYIGIAVVVTSLMANQIYENKKLRTNSEISV